MDGGKIKHSRMGKGEKGFEDLMSIKSWKIKRQKCETLYTSVVFRDAVNIATSQKLESINYTTAYNQDREELFRYARK
jgi:hypothetical protein